MAYAEKRPGSKTWRARYQRPDGSWASEPGFPTRRKAEEYGDDQEAAMRAGTWIDPKAGERTLADWWAEWFPAQTYRPNTAETYERRWLKQIEPRWGSTPLNRIRGIDLDKWIKELSQSLAPSSVGTVLAPLRDCFDDAVHNRLIPASPMPPKGRRGRRALTVAPPREGVVIPLEQAEAIMLRLRPDEALLVLIALFTGMRWSELAAMRRQYLTLHPPRDGQPASGWYFVHPVEGAVHEDKHSRRFLDPPKSGVASGRIIDLPPFLVLILLAYLEALPDGQDVLFPPLREREGAQFRNYDSWNTGRWRPACDGRPAKVYKNGRVREALAPIHKGLRLHDCKHTHKAMLNNGRIHPAMQNYRLGHAEQGAAGAYSHPTPEMRAETTAWLEQVWQAWNPTRLIEHLSLLWARPARRQVPASAPARLPQAALPPGEQDSLF
jgi:integrase